MIEMMRLGIPPRPVKKIIGLIFADIIDLYSIPEYLSSLSIDLLMDLLSPTAVISDTSFPASTRFFTDLVRT